MQFITAIAGALLAAASVSALPTATTSVTSAASSTPTGNFYFKTSLIQGEGSLNKRFDNLYVNPYHTGAGLNDVQLTVNASETAFFNGTSLEWNLGDYPSAMVMSTYTEYTAWQPVEINGGYGQEYGGFFVNATGLQWASDLPGLPDYNEFLGWMVCEWWHGVPQLFWRISQEEAKRPGFCSDVNLIPVPA